MLIPSSGSTHVGRMQYGARALHRGNAALRVAFNSDCPSVEFAISDLIIDIFFITDMCQLQDGVRG